MRVLTGAETIRIRKPRPVLTGATRIRLSQIRDLAAWHEQLVNDKHDKAEIGTVREWADGKKHVKTAHGWELASRAEIKRARKIGPIESYTKAARQKEKQKTDSQVPKMEKLTGRKAIHEAIEKYKETKEEKIYDLGKITPSAKKRIKKNTGLDPERVILETGSLTHTIKDYHNLYPGDLERMKEIVDNATDIRLSPEKDDSGHPIIVFREKEPNGLNLFMEFRSGRLFLELKTAYRQKKGTKI